MNPASDPNLPPPTNGAPLPRVADVGAQRVARVYAEALVAAASAQGQEDAVLGEVEALVADVFRHRPELEMLLSSLAIGRERKKNMIRSAFTGRASDIFVNFLLVLNDHDRLDLLPAIRAECVELREKQKGLMRVEVLSAVPLPDDQREQLIGQLRGLFGKQPVLEMKVDPEILGGLVVRVGDWLYDASVRAQLDNIRKHLFESASHGIQSRRDQFSSS